MVVQEERGFALLLTLLVVLLLTLLIFSFFYEARVYLLQAQGRVDLLRAYYLARSGVGIKIKLLKEDRETDPYDSLSEGWAKEEKIESPIGTIEVEAIDEESKFNINTLVRGNGLVDERAVERFRRLLTYLGLSGRLADRVVEYLKGRGETSYDIGDLSQLLEQDGIEPYHLEVLDGFVTVNSSGLININTAPKEVLLALSEEMTEDLAEAIMEYREEEPFREKSDLKDVHGITDKVLITFSDIIDVKSNFFTIRSTGESRGIRRRITVLVERGGRGVEVIKWKEG